MKTILTLLLGLILFQSPAQAQWEQIITGYDNDLNSLHFVADTKGFIVGNGIVLKTTDGENFTKLVDSNLTGFFTFYKVFFLNEHSGFVLGTGPKGHCLLRTSNAGLSWKPVSFLEPTQVDTFHFLGDNIHDKYEFDFINSKVGYFVFFSNKFTDTYQELFFTNDSGKIWRSIQSRRFSPNTYYINLEMKDSLKGIIVHDASINVSKDGFMSSDAKLGWSGKGNAVSNYYKDNTWFVYSKNDYDLCFISDDDGESWTKTNTRYYLGHGNIIFREGYPGKKTSVSSDGGIVWKQLPLPPRPYNDYQYLSENAGYTVTIQGIVHRMKSSTSVQNSFANDVAVAVTPNPAINEVTFSFPESQKSEVLIIFDALGREVVKKQVLIDVRSYTLDVQTLSAGVYFARFGSVISRFIKQ